MMTEIEKLDAGLPFDIFDPAVNARKLHAVKMTEALNAVPVTDHEKRVSFLKHVNGGLIFVNSPILKFVNGAQKPHLRCADSLPTIRFPAVYLPFLKNQWKITWISRSVCE